MQPFPIFELPAEIRSLILCFALRSGHELCDIRPNARAMDNQLLATSRQLHNEALPIFYGCNVFRLELFNGLQELPAWITQRSHHTLYIRKVHLQISNHSYKLLPANEEPVVAVARNLALYPKLAFFKLTIVYHPLTRDTQDQVHPPPFDDIVGVFAGVPGATQVILQADDQLGMKYKIRKARADAEELKQRIREKKGTLPYTVQEQRRRKR